MVKYQPAIYACPLNIYHNSQAIWNLSICFKNNTLLLSKCLNGPALQFNFSINAVLEQLMKILAMEMSKLYSSTILDSASEFDTILSKNI